MTVYPGFLNGSLVLGSMCGERGREREGGVLGRERERERDRERERESKLYYPRIKVELRMSVGQPAFESGVRGCARRKSGKPCC